MSEYYCPEHKYNPPENSGMAFCPQCEVPEAFPKMKTIYKYPIKITDQQDIIMPQGAEVIQAGLDPQGTPCVWAMVDTRNEPEPMSILVYGTGNPMLFDPLRHVGSFVRGPYVWHVFLG